MLCKKTTIIHAECKKGIYLCYTHKMMPQHVQLKPKPKLELELAHWRVHAVPLERVGKPAAWLRRADTALIISLLLFILFSAWFILP